MGNNIEKNHIARVTYEKTLRASPNKKAAKPLPYKPSPRREGGLRQRRSGAFVCRTNAPLFPCTTNCLSCHSHPIRPCGAPSPRGEGCDTRIPSSKKGGEAATRALNPSYQSTHSAFLPPSFGRRCPEGAEVGYVKRYFHTRGCQPRLASLVCPFQRKGRE